MRRGCRQIFLPLSVPNFGTGTNQVSRSSGSGERWAAVPQRFTASSNARGHRACGTTALFKGTKSG